MRPRVNRGLRLNSAFYGLRLNSAFYVTFTLAVWGGGSTARVSFTHKVEFGFKL